MSEPAMDTKIAEQAVEAALAEVNPDPDTSVDEVDVETEVEAQVENNHAVEPPNSSAKAKPEAFISAEPVSKILFSEDPGEEAFAPEEAMDGENLTLSDLKAVVDEMDDNIDEALGNAADSIWKLATSVTGKVSTVVKEGQPGLENLRKNVTSRLAPLDNIGRDFKSQIGAFAQNDKPLATITGSMKSVAASVQRNAEAMEAAILAKANQTEQGTNMEGSGDSDLQIEDLGVGVIPMVSSNREITESEIDVNEEIAKVGATISNSIVGQTVGGLWTGLWGNFVGGEGEEDEDLLEESIPKNRFEQRIFELQANPETYCEPAKDLNAFEEWMKSFVLDDHADSCIAILDAHPAIAKLYENLVPLIVDEDTFWMRYFFARHVLEQDEERRKKLLERADNAVIEGENDEEGWGDDDWDGDLEVKPDAVESSPQQAGPAVPPGTQSGEQAIAGIRDLKAEGTETEDSPAADASAKATGPQGKQERRERRADPGPAPTTQGAPAQPEDGWGADDWE